MSRIFVFTAVAALTWAVPAQAGMGATINKIHAWRKTR